MYMFYWFYHYTNVYLVIHIYIYSLSLSTLVKTETFTIIFTTIWVWNMSIYSYITRVLFLFQMCRAPQQFSHVYIYSPFASYTNIVHRPYSTGCWFLCMLLLMLLLMWNIYYIVRLEFNSKKPSPKKHITAWCCIMLGSSLLIIVLKTMFSVSLLPFVL